MGSLSLLRDREFLALSGTAFARAQAYSTIAIALALYAEQFGTTSTVEGLFGTAFALAQLVIVLPLGRKIDTGNAKRYLLAGLVLNVLVFVGFVFVGSVEHVILVRVVQGLGASLLWITGSTVVGEISPDGERGQWLGTYNQVGAFSSLAGDLVGGALLALYGFTLTYAVLAAVTVGAALLVLLALRENPGGRTDPEEATGVETIRNLLGRRAIRALVTFRLGLSFGKMCVILFLPIYARTAFGMNPFLVGGILAGGKVTKGLTQGYVGTLTDRLGGKHRFVAAGALLYAVGTALIPLAEVGDRFFPAVTLTLPPGIATGTVTLVPAFFVLFGAYGVCGVADSIRLPASMALFVEEGEEFDAVAGSMSLRSIAWKVGQVTGPVTVGAVWDATDVTTAFVTAAAFIAVATGVFVLLYRGVTAPDVVPTPGD
ncbi:MFS transporter [Salinirubellus salinus]|uniref:MFS transporter n=1 Tax=Salinirubellus salinus TaxID=1364945 RepID=A0A9E7R5Q5_9EURY|nr:MFS transporter [Salinirubellus salinus]UWM56390.1 MFS transporter [Salinirubellus salinus]